MSFQNMVALIINNPLHSFTLIIFFILLTLCTSKGDDDMYKNCSSSVSCGNLSNVGYPFWGLGRPIYCGHPALQLLCESNEYPVLKIGDDADEVYSYYSVLSLNNSSPNMTIQLRELQFPEIPCPFHQSDKKFDKIFQFRESVENITLIYECHGHEMPELLLLPETCWGYNTSAYYPNNTLDTRPFQLCKHIEVPVLSAVLKNFLHENETLQNVLDKGFEVDYLNFSACFNCQNSGGICWSDDTEFTCFDKKPAKRKTKGAKWKTKRKLIFGLAAFAATGVATGIGIFIALFLCLRKRR